LNINVLLPSVAPTASEDNKAGLGSNHSSGPNCGLAGHLADSARLMQLLLQRIAAPKTPLLLQQGLTVHAQMTICAVVLTHEGRAGQRLGWDAKPFMA